MRDGGSLKGGSKGGAIRNHALKPPTDLPFMSNYTTILHQRPKSADFILIKPSKRLHSLQLHSTTNIHFFIFLFFIFIIFIIFLFLFFFFIFICFISFFLFIFFYFNFFVYFNFFFRFFSFKFHYFFMAFRSRKLCFFIFNLRIEFFVPSFPIFVCFFNENFHRCQTILFFQFFS